MEKETKTKVCNGIKEGGRVKTPNINKKTRCTFLCGCTTSFCFSTKKSLINNLYGVIWVK